METKTIAWFSAGVSSAVATKLMIDKIDHIIYTHIEDQHPDTMRFVKECEAWFGKPVEIMQSPYKNVENALLGASFINSPYGAPCTNILKKRVRIEWEAKNEFFCFLDYIWGMDADEADRCQGLEESMPNQKHIFPLVERGIDKDKAHQILKASGIKRPVMYDLGYQNNNCFSGDTRFITDSGVVSFNEAVGKQVNILNRKGWEKAEVNCFGSQEIIELTVKNGPRIDKIRTTGGHEWFVPRYKNQSQGIIVKKTDELSLGDRPLVSFIVPSIKLDRVGVQNGFVFGDGTLHRCKNQNNYSSAYFSEEKDEISYWFDKNMNPSRCINGLPPAYKEIPKSNDLSYLAGFLAGMIASDGCVSKSGVTISNKSIDIIHKLIDIAKRLGMVAWAGKDICRDTNYKKGANLSHMIMPRICVPDNMILRGFHKDRMEGRKTRPKAWEVIGINHTGKKEDVFCVTVNGSPEFTLENNILTSNCIGCVKGGMAYWNHIRVDFPEVFLKRSLMERKVGASCIHTEKGRVFLDELDPERGRDDPPIVEDCGIFCETMAM